LKERFNGVGHAVDATGEGDRLAASAAGESVPVLLCPVFFPAEEEQVFPAPTAFENDMT
jgi:hypothetical protein